MSTFVDHPEAHEDEPQVKAQYALKPVEPAPVRWPVTMLGVGSTGLVATGATPLVISGGASAMAVAAAASTAVTAAAVTLSVRRERRLELGLETRVALERITGPLSRFRCRRWQGWYVGAPQVVHIRYSAAAVVVGQPWPRSGVSMVSAVLGGSYRVARHDERRGVLVLRRTSPESVATIDARETRAAELMRQLFGQDARVRTRLDNDTLRQVQVAHGCGIKATFGGWRDRVERVVSTMLEGRWRARWDLENDTVTFELRPDIASFVKRPAMLPPVDHPDFLKIPLGPDEDHQVVSWDLMSSLPHFLIAGKTGKGKSLDCATEVPTPTGWRKMGDLQVGDEVFDDQGRPTAVTGVYDQPRGRECFEVVFSDGSTIVADAEHLWWTEDRAARTAKWVRRQPRRRRTRLDEAALATLRLAILESTDDETLTIPEAARLLGIHPSTTWIRAAAESIGVASERVRVVDSPYPAQVVQQDQKVRVYPAGATEQHLRLAAGELTRLAPWRLELEQLHVEDDLTVRELADRTGVPRDLLRHVLNTSALESRIETRAVELKVAAKTVRRRFGTTRAYPKRLFLTALASCGGQVLNDQRAKHAGGQVRTTREIKATLLTATGHLNHTVPVARPLVLPDTDLPIGPYTLGQWLGDGASWQGAITTGDPEVADHIRTEGYEVNVQALATDATKGCRTYGIPGLRAQLRACGLLKTDKGQGSTKRIPPQYLRASPQQRRELLAGLLDSDGTVSPQGTTQFTTVLPGLAHDVYELLVSLGFRVSRVEGRARFRGKDCGKKWTLAFTTTEPVFKINRKLQSLQERTTHHNPARNNQRYVRDVRPVPEVPMRCITVDSPSHLFLAGESMIPTHNTVVLRGVVMEAAARGLAVWAIDPKRVELISLRGWPNVQLVATSIEQQVATIMQAWEVMEDRYRAIESGEASEEDFSILVIVLDEFAEFSRRVSQWWTRVKRTGQPSVCPVFEHFDSLVRLGRTAGLRIAIGIQRPDARFFGESAEARDNFDSRMSLGRLSPDGSRMMWGSSIGTSLSGVRGRAIACTSEDAASEIQAMWVPDPRRTGPLSDPEDQRLLDALRPSTVTHGPLRIDIPEPVPDEKGRLMVWESILSAALVPAEDVDPTDDVDPVGDNDSDTDTGTDDDTGSDAGRLGVAALKANRRRPDTPGVTSARILAFPVRSAVEPADDYGPPDQVAVGKVDDGDLVMVDDRWVVVEAVEPDPLDAANVLLAWRSVDDGSDDDGSETLDKTEAVSRRRPLED